MHRETDRQIDRHVARLAKESNISTAGQKQADKQIDKIC